MYPYVWWDNTFTPSELDDIMEYCDIQGVERGRVVQSADSQEPNEQVRVSNVQFHSVNDDTRWIFQKLNHAIDQINNTFYGFDLIGYDAFQYGEYSGEESGKYDWHMDTIMGPPGEGQYLMRKMSLSLLLNEPGTDFEGGEFELTDSGERATMVPEFTKGRIIAFPSFMIHRVKPVTEGLRKSIVVWVTGPKFR